MWNLLTGSIWPLSVLVINLWALYQICGFVLDFIVAVFKNVKSELEDFKNNEGDH